RALNVERAHVSDRARSRLRKGVCIQVIRDRAAVAIRACEYLVGPLPRRRSARTAGLTGQGTIETGNECNEVSRRHSQDVCQLPARRESSQHCTLKLRPRNRGGESEE